MGNAREMDFGSLMVGNFFAWRWARPAELLLVRDPAGPENQFHLEEMSKESNSILCAWGNEATLKKLGITDGRRYFPPSLLQKSLQVLKLSASGIPGHPLYLPSGIRPFVWEK